MLFTSLMTEFYEDSHMAEQIERMFAHIKMQVENPRMSESDFKLDQNVHLHINFQKLGLTRGSSYIKLPEWIAKKKAVINPKNDNKECFKWAVLKVLLHKEIENNPQHTSRLQHYEDQYNWNRLEFSLAIHKKGTLEKNNLETA